MGSLWNRSGMVERYADDLRATGAKAYFFQGGTTTPLTVFQDSGEGSAHTHPVVADDNGRWPDVFVPYLITGYDVRVTSKDDVQLTFSLGIPNPNPVDTTVVVQPEQTVQTGMVHPSFDKGPKTGYVRLNGNTIGNATTSGPNSERANDDCRNLYRHVYDNVPDTIAPVSGGRTSSADADFDANKTIVLPDMRGVGFVGIDDMGATAAGRFAGLTFNVGNATTSGSGIGTNSLTLTVQQLPAHTHTGQTAAGGNHTHNTTVGGSTGVESADHAHGFSGTTSDQSASHTHGYTLWQAANIATAGPNTVGGTSGTPSTTDAASNGHTHTYSGTTGGITANHTHSWGGTFGSTADGNHTHSFTTDATGSGAVINNLPISRLITWFIKL